MTRLKAEAHSFLFFTPIEKEHNFPNLPFLGFHVNFPGCSLFFLCVCVFFFFQCFTFSFSPESPVHSNLCSSMYQPGAIVVTLLMIFADARPSAICTSTSYAIWLACRCTLTLSKMMKSPPGTLAECFCLKHLYQLDPFHTNQHQT